MRFAGIKHRLYNGLPLGALLMLLNSSLRCRTHLKPTNDSWRVDETYIEVKGEWKYLYRAVDSEGNTLEFMLSAKHDARAAKRFFRKAMNATHNQSPRVINVDQNAAYPKAIDSLKAAQTLTETCELRQNKYFNNMVEQSHRFIKRLVNPGMGFGSFNTARRTLSGYEAMNMKRIGTLFRALKKETFWVKWDSCLKFLGLLHN